MSEWRVSFPKPERRGKKQPKPVLRHRRPKRVSERQRKVMRDDADWARIVKNWADDKCEVCFARATDSHHIKAKSTHPKLRHNPMNGAALCRLHHRWAHSFPGHFREWLRLSRPNCYMVLFQ